MTNFILKRVALMILSLFIVILITFSLMHAVPGGPFTREKRLPPEVEAALNEKYHLNDPLPKQFFEYVKGLFTFDLGPSMKYQGKTVNDFIANGFPYSAKVGGVTILFVLITAIPLGIWAALNNNKWQDGLVLILATVGVTIPSFVVATLLMYLFSYQFDILPAFWDNSWKAYILPIIALGGYSVAFISRLMRSSLLEVMGQDYIRTARSKGLTERQVITRHALRNALIPVITVLGPTIAGLLTGSFVIEKIFAVPGMGVHFVDSVGQRDYTAIMGITFFYATFLIVMVFIVDIFYMLIDPRIKFNQ